MAFLTHDFSPACTHLLALPSGSSWQGSGTRSLGEGQVLEHMVT